MSKHSVLIDEILYNDIKEYCELNGLKTSEFINQQLKDAFLMEKYGDAPFMQKQEKNIEVRSSYPLNLPSDKITPIPIEEVITINKKEEITEKEEQIKQPKVVEKNKKDTEIKEENTSNKIVKRRLK